MNNNSDTNMKGEFRLFGIYSIKYTSTTQLIVRYRGVDACNYLLFDYLHYWQGFETFYRGENYCCINGIEEIREATPAEKQSLLRKELETNTY